MSDSRRRWWPWALLALVGLLVAGYVWAIVRGADEATARAREALQAEERRRATAEGFLAAQEARAGELEDALEVQTEHSLGLEQQLARLRRSFPDARPTAVAERTSETIAVERDRLCPEPPVGDPPAGISPPGTASSTAGPAPPPVALEVVARDVALVTEAGARLVAGVAELWRLEPQPRELLGAASWRADASSLVALERPEDLPGPPPALEFGLLAWTDQAVSLDAAWHRRGRRWSPVVAVGYGLDEQSVYLPSYEAVIAGDSPWRVGVGIRLRVGPSR